jgi:hypothetical protein
MVRQSGTGIQIEFDPAEESLAQCLVLAELEQKLLKSLWNIEIDRWRYFTQVADCFGYALRRWLASIDIKGTAIGKDMAKIVVAAKVWCQGSQSTNTGGSSFAKASQCVIAA